MNINKIVRYLMLLFFVFTGVAPLAEAQEDYTLMGMGDNGLGQQVVQERRSDRTVPADGALAASCLGRHLCPSHCDEDPTGHLRGRLSGRLVA